MKAAYYQKISTDFTVKNQPNRVEIVAQLNENDNQVEMSVEVIQILL